MLSQRESVQLANSKQRRFGSEGAAAKAKRAAWKEPTRIAVATLSSHHANPVMRGYIPPLELWPVLRPRRMDRAVLGLQGCKFASVLVACFPSFPPLPEKGQRWTGRLESRNKTTALAFGPTASRELGHTPTPPGPFLVWGVASGEHRCHLLRSFYAPAQLLLNLPTA